MLRFLACLAASLLLASPSAYAFRVGPDGDGATPPAEENTGRRHRSLTSSDGYMPLDPLTASVHADFRLRGILHIEAGLEIPNARNRSRAERLMPRLRDRYVSALALYTGANYRFGDVPDADRISYLLQEATDDVLGEDTADVLLGMIIIHEN